MVFLSASDYRGVIVKDDKFFEANKLDMEMCQDDRDVLNYRWRVRRNQWLRTGDIAHKVAAERIHRDLCELEEWGYPSYLMTTIS